MGRQTAQEINHKRRENYHTLGFASENARSLAVAEATARSTASSTWWGQRGDTFVRKTAELGLAANADYVARLGQYEADRRKDLCSGLHLTGPAAAKRKAGRKAASSAAPQPDDAGTNEPGQHEGSAGVSNPNVPNAQDQGASSTPGQAHGDQTPADDAPSGSAAAHLGVDISSVASRSESVPGVPFPKKAMAFGILISACGTVRTAGSEDMLVNTGAFDRTVQLCLEAWGAQNTLLEYEYKRTGMNLSLGCGRRDDGRGMALIASPTAKLRELLQQVVCTIIAAVEPRVHKKTKDRAGEFIAELKTTGPPRRYLKRIVICSLCHLVIVHCCVLCM